MRILHGTPASAGIAAGPWHVVDLAPVPAGGPLRPGTEEGEIDRLLAAAEAAAADLTHLAEQLVADGHPTEASIFSAQAAMARDPALLRLAEAEIRLEGKDAVAGIRAAGDEMAGRLRTLGDGLLAERATDVLDVAARMARRASGRGDADAPRLARPAIVVAADLLPSVTATLPRDRLLGFVLERGSATSHAAILARAYGLPAVVGVHGLLAALTDVGVSAATIGLDGTAGDVFIAPDAATREELSRRRRRAARARRRGRSEATDPTQTRDGTAITLLANVGLPEEVERAIDMGARGIGLFRTEFLFVERALPPDEDEQVAIYRAMVEAMAPHPVTIRLLDVGGDKPIPYLPLAPEANPFLGVRGLRLAADRPELFRTQIRAAMRAAVAGPVKAMAPMVTDAADAELLRRLAEEAGTELREAGIAHRSIPLGAMLEVPAAILTAHAYLGELEFASLGTNDLAQYTLAADRGNAALGAYQDPLHPALLRLVAEAVDVCGKVDIDLSVCGEMAGDPAGALALIGLGVRHLSMTPSAIPAVRRAIRRADLANLRAESTAALSDAGAAAVRARFARLLPS